MHLTRLALGLLLIAGCGSVDSNGPSGPDGTTRVFDVTFLDTSGAEVSRAVLTFAPPAAGEAADGTYRHVSGRRLATSETLRATAPTDGPVRVALDPGISDGGVELLGPFSAGTSQGSWSTGSFVGPVPGGTFRADRQ